MLEYRGRIVLADAGDMIRGGDAFNCATRTDYEPFAARWFADGTRL